MRPRLWIEPFAGTASVALALIGDLRPPVGYMGSKRRFAERILAHLGLAPGDGCDGLLLADAGPWGWVWPVLLDPERCLRVAGILRSWAGEDPRALWDRLVKEPVPEDVERAAGHYLWIQARSAATTPVWFDGLRWAMNARVNGTATSESRPACQKGTNAEGWGGVTTPSTVAARLEHLAAAFLALSAGSFGAKPVTVADGPWRTSGFAGLISDQSRERGFPERLDPRALAGRIQDLGRAAPARVVYQGRAEDVLPWDYHERDVVYLDPPYQGCTGYAADCSRAAVIDLAWAWSNAGATVVVSEAVPLEEFEDWHRVEITDCARAGLGKGGQVLQVAKKEWLTMNRAPRPITSALPLFRGAA